MSCKPRPPGRVEPGGQWGKLLGQLQIWQLNQEVKPSCCPG